MLDKRGKVMLNFQYARLYFFGLLAGFIAFLLTGCGPLPEYEALPDMGESCCTVDTVSCRVDVNANGCGKVSCLCGDGSRCGYGSGPC